MSEKQTYHVGVLGVLAFELKILKRIFSLSTSRGKVYKMLSELGGQTPNIFLVDTSNQKSVAQLRAYRKVHPGIPVIKISKQDEPADGASVRRPITATRLLSTFDQAVEQCNEQSKAAEQSPQLEKTPTPITPIPGTLAPRTPTPISAAPETPAPKVSTSVTKPQKASTMSIVAPSSDSDQKALVVDDSCTVRKQVGNALKKSGISAEFADSGEMALGMVEKCIYDIIFLDVIMPGVDGYAVCKKIKRSRNTKHIPVVMLTGKSSAFDKVKGKLSGCDTYLTKPVSLKEFNQTLSKCLHTSNAIAIS